MQTQSVLLNGVFPSQPPPINSVVVSPSPVMALSPPAASTFPVPDDFWTEDASFTLIEAWRELHLVINRRNSGQKQWQEVADAVNSRYGFDRKSFRTKSQCKNRIDYLKKKYRIEKARVSESGGSYISNWPFLSCLDDVFGSHNKFSTPVGSNFKASPVTTTMGWSLFSQVPVGPRSGSKKRRSTHVHGFGNSYLRRDETLNEVDRRDDLDFERSRWRPKATNRETGYRELARAITEISDIYERVEVTKQRQIIELEMQRMQFTKDLECQRMQLLMEMHLQIRKIKRAKGASGADCYSQGTK